MHVADFMQCAFMYARRRKKAYTYFHADLESQIPLLPAQWYENYAKILKNFTDISKSVTTSNRGKQTRLAPTSRKPVMGPAWQSAFQIFTVLFSINIATQVCCIIASHSIYPPIWYVVPWHDRSWSAVFWFHLQLLLSLFLRQWSLLEDPQTTLWVPTNSLQ